MCEYSDEYMNYIRLAVASLFVVLLCAGLPVSVGAVGEPVPNESDTVTISDGLSSASGEQTIVVQLSERSQSAIQSTATSDQPAAMRAHATETQHEIVTFAEDDPHVEIDSQLWLVNAVVLTVDTTAVPLERIADLDHVEEIHENYEVQVASAATDNAGSTAPVSPRSLVQPATVGSIGSTAEQTPTRAIETIGVPDVWDTYNTRGEGVRVAVIDTGVNPDHPDIDIADDDWVCYIDCIGNPDGPHDVDGHGTHVSGTIVGGDANDAGLQIGVAPESTLLHAKGLGDDGIGTFESITQSMQWAIDNDADVLTMSLGTDGTSDGFIEPVQNAHHSGVPVVASVGNDGAGTSGSPANVYEAIAVGSIDIEPAYPTGVQFGLEDDTVSEFSGGETITSNDWTDPPAEWPDTYTVPDVTAPGSVIWSADTNLETETCDGVSTTDLNCLQGTSMAAPHVAGVAALMQSSTDSTLSPDEIQSTLQSTAVDIGDTETRQGAGRIDAVAAVDAVADSPDGEPDFQITEMEVFDEDITEGETLAVDVTVTNDGTAVGTQNVTLSVNETTVDTKAIESLEPEDDSRTVTLTYETTVGDAPSVDVVAATDTDSMSRTATVRSATEETTSSANRTLSATNVQSGATVTVTTTASFNRTTSDASIVETIDPAVDSDQVTVSSVSENNTQNLYQESSGTLISQWSAVDSISISYELTVPDDAPDGATYTVSGEAEDRETSNTVAIENDTITVSNTVDAPGGVTIPRKYAANDNGDVSPFGLLDAGTDFQNGKIGPTTLLDVGTAFQNT